MGKKKKNKLVMDETIDTVELLLVHCDKEFDYHDMIIREGQWYGILRVDQCKVMPVMTRGREVGGKLRIHPFYNGKWLSRWVNIEYVDFEFLNHFISDLTDDQRYLLPEFAGGMSEKQSQQFRELADKYIEENPNSQRAKELWELIYGKNYK